MAIMLGFFFYYYSTSIKMLRTSPQGAQQSNRRSVIVLQITSLWSWQCPNFFHSLLFLSFNFPSVLYLFLFGLIFYLVSRFTYMHCAMKKTSPFSVKKFILVSVYARKFFNLRKNNEGGPCSQDNKVGHILVGQVRLGHSIS